MSRLVLQQPWSFTECKRALVAFVERLVQMLSGLFVTAHVRGYKSLLAAGKKIQHGPVELLRHLGGCFVPGFPEYFQY
jgi:hypothetical protein